MSSNAQLLSLLCRLRVDGLVRHHNRCARCFTFMSLPSPEDPQELLHNLQKRIPPQDLSHTTPIICTPRANLHLSSRQLIFSLTTRLCSEITASALKPSEITEREYDICAEETLYSLLEFFEELPENESCNDDYDCAYGNGVLTVHLGSAEGTYVINKQVPNKQIWLSSPLSGPKRYDYVDGQWLYVRDGKGLHRLLEEELTALLGPRIELKNSKFYSWGAQDNK